MSTKIFVDGSNVLFWNGNSPDQEVPELVVRALVARRFNPVIYFDNSIFRYLGQGTLETLMSIAQVVVAPAGTPADVMLLDVCGQGRHQIVSNDRFRAWRCQHPALQAKWLVTGEIGKGRRVSFSKKLRAASF